MSKLCYRLESPPYHPPHLRTDCKSCQSVTLRHLCLHTTVNTTCCGLPSYRGIDRIVSEFIERTLMFAQLSIWLIPMLNYQLGLHPSTTDPNHRQKSFATPLISFGGQASKLVRSSEPQVRFLLYDIGWYEGLILRNLVKHGEQNG